MFYHNITTCDMKNGDGLRVVLWVAGCTHRCNHCQNPQTWDHCSGIEFDENTIKEICSELEKDYHKGITLSGGDPLSETNRIEMTILSEFLKKLYPHKDIWCYTGYSFDEVKDLPIMQYIDVLVDGKYEEGLSSPSPKWRGSSNQKIYARSSNCEWNDVTDLY